MNRFTISDVYNIMSGIVSKLDLSDEFKRFYIEIVTMRYGCIICRKDFDQLYTDLEDRLGGL